ncbi:ribonuclease III [Cylindrobasidium torrendii FP15055 ss-10]|uniref:Ribonuclease III n=1 Tax=Cylindrobasidium torrendii FP15055 ss-10 TaxID=1314674 RepID=A0A0D7BSY7_9AGAR|nr:ribonuclease III [Cylindrobasidium torrendii FP15055 ss-10]
MLKRWKNQWSKDEDEGSSSAKRTATSAGLDDAPSKTDSIQHTKRRRLEENTNWPCERIVLYDPVMHEPSHILLSKIICNETQQHPFFVVYLATAQRVYEELGTCASNLWWKRALPDIERQLKLCAETDDSPDLLTRTRNKARETINRFMYILPNLNPYAMGFNVSPKFLRLVQTLKACEPVSKGFRAIVFVDSTLVATSLLELVRMLNDLSSFTPRVLDTHRTEEEQMALLEAFANNEFNLLFATTNTEDLDIPRSSLVVRWALPNDYLSHAHTYAHTAGSSSNIVLLAEQQHPVQRAVLERLSTMPTDLKQWGMEASYTTFPPATLEVLRPFSRPVSERQEGQHLTEPVTGVWIHPSSAPLHAYRFAAWFGAQDRIATAESIQYDRMELTTTFTCVVSVPGLPTDTFRSDAAMSKAVARRMACYKLCSYLLQHGLFDYKLFYPAKPIDYVPPPMPTLTSTQQGTRLYTRKRPHIWGDYSYQFDGVLYPTIIRADIVKRDGPKFAPLVLLTRAPLPDLRSVGLWFEKIVEHVPLVRAAPLQISQGQIEQLRNYLVRLLRQLSGRRDNCPLENIAYFFAPLKPKLTWTTDIPTSAVDIALSIDWDGVAAGAAGWSIPLKFGSPETVEADVQDALIKDRPGEFGKPFDIVLVRPDLTPHSAPVDRPIDDAASQSLLAYMQARSSLTITDNQQCILEVSQSTNWFDHLTPGVSGRSENKGKKYLIPEVIFKSTIPASIYRTTFLLDSIMQRIDELLIVKELNASLFAHSLREDLLRVAITSHAVGHEFNYERLEFLGDAVLKLVSSVYVVATEPQSVGMSPLHFAREALISNAPLHACAVKVDFPAYANLRPTKRAGWIIPNFNLEDDAGNPQLPNPQNITKTSSKHRKKKKRRLFDTDATHWAGDKMIADMVEGVVGASYLTGGKDLALYAMKALGAPLPRALHWSDLVRQAAVPSADISAPIKPTTIKSVERILGYSFNKPFILGQALVNSILPDVDRRLTFHQTHRTHAGVSYERLEFLGDAVLGLLAVEHIWSLSETWNPNVMTVFRASMVSNKTFAALAVHSGLSQYILIDERGKESGLERSMKNYIQAMNTLRDAEEQQARRQGRPPKPYWQDHLPPKPLADIIESIFAAVFVCEQFDTKAVEGIYDRVMRPFYEQYLDFDTTEHPFDALIAKGKDSGCADIRSVRKDAGFEVYLHDQVIGRSENRNPHVAYRSAAATALRSLEDDLGLLGRACGCSRQ